MNESFFGKYSVFCVFGSVVGCVVVPLIAQLVQQQSMECMILSIIFLTLTAAHLKKRSNDGSHSKLLFSREYEKRKYTAQINNNHKKQKQNSNNHQQKNQQQQQQQNDQEYHQKYEHLKVLEMEKRNEEKRLKKQKKREERLKRKEEELKKQKETEEKSKERRKKYRKDNTSFNSNVPNNCEKYYCSDYRPSNQTPRKYRSLSQDEGQTPFNRHSYSTRNNIPRFNNTARKTRAHQHENNHYSSYITQVRSTSDALTINCSHNLSTSCSSLSSISSSGSTSPPPPPTSPNSLNGVGTGISPWNKKPYHLSDSALKSNLTNGNAELGHLDELNPSWSFTNSNIKEEPLHVRQNFQQKNQFYQNLVKCNVTTRSIRNNKILSCDFDSSSLFSTQDKEGSVNLENTKGAGEYSLFGSHQFGSSFIKSPII